MGEKPFVYGNFLANASVIVLAASSWFGPASSYVPSVCSQLSCKAVKWSWKDSVTPVAVLEAEKNCVVTNF